MWTALLRTKLDRSVRREESEPEIQPCSQCLRCVHACPTGALHYRERLWSLDLDLCHQCGDCAAVCPNILINARRSYSA